MFSERKCRSKSRKRFYRAKTSLAKNAKTIRSVNAFSTVRETFSLGVFHLRVTFSLYVRPVRSGFEGCFARYALFRSVDAFRSIKAFSALRATFLSGKSVLAR